MYLSQPRGTNAAAMIRHMAFLEALFKEVIKELERYEVDTWGGIAFRWYQWRKEGATTDENGSNRSQLYSRVLQRAKNMCEFSLLR
jgi:hypothetical protein